MGFIEREPLLLLQFKLNIFTSQH